MSATDSTDTTTEPTAPAEPDKPAADDEAAEKQQAGEKDQDAPLGPNGEKALKAEREARSNLEKQIADMKREQVTQRDAFAKALGLQEDETPDAGKLAEQLSESQRTAAENASALTRYKLAIAKEVPSHLIEFVTGSNEDEVTASIEKVMGAFAASKPSGPQPDPSQGHQGEPTSLEAQIAAAEKAGDKREVFRLKARKGMTTN